MNDPEDEVKDILTEDDDLGDVELGEAACTLGEDCDSCQ